MKVNISKCAHMYFRPNLNNNEKFKKVDKIKFLGVIIDDQLSWNDQIEHVQNKLLSKIALLKRINKIYPTIPIYENLSLFI